MKIIMLLIISLFYYTVSYNQESITLNISSSYASYYKSIALADSLYLSRDFLTADSIYQKAFNNVKRPFKHDYFSAFKNCLVFNREKAFQYLQKGCKLGLTNKQLKALGTKALLNKSEQHSIHKFINTIEIQKNDSLVKIVRKMEKKDQKARVFWTNWLKWEKQVKIMDKVDRPNAIKLLEISQKMGWPGFSSIGENTFNKYDVEDVSLLILHFTKEEYTNLLPYMVKAVEMGEMYPYHLARCTDYLYMGTESDSAGYKILDIKQIYGTMYSGQEIIPFGTIEEVNERRKNIGLESIEQYAQKRNLALPKAQKIHYIAK